MIFELSTDSLFHDQVARVDTRVDNDFAPSDGEVTFDGVDSLETGHMYNWRMLHVDSDGRHGEWSYSTFLISAMSSTWLGGDRYEFRLKQGNASSDGLHPECADTYIDSGMPNSNYGSETELQASYNTIPSETTILFGCDLSSTFLPTGYAVESANLEFYLSTPPSGTPVVGAWENTQNDWTEDGIRDRSPSRGLGDVYKRQPQCFTVPWRDERRSNRDWVRPIVFDEETRLVIFRRSI